MPPKKSGGTIQNATQSAQSIDTLALLRRILPDETKKGKHTFVDILTLGRRHAIILGANSRSPLYLGSEKLVRYGRRRRFTLMPLIALGSLSLAVTVPMLSAATIHAAAPVRYATVIVQPGDNVWSLAERRVPRGSDVQSVVDDIVAINHISESGLFPGQRIRIPQ
jgi:hypothetical protein